jgi:hypothetical protein
VGAGNVDFFVERIQPRHILCTEANTPPQGIGAPPCDRVGQELDVIAWNHGVEGGLLPQDSAVESFRWWFETSLSDETDQYGSGKLRVLGYYDGGPDGLFALTSIRDPEDTGFDEPWRAVMTFSFEFIGGEWRIVAAGTPGFREEWLAGDFEGWVRWEN